MKTLTYVSLFAGIQELENLIYTFQKEVSKIIEKELSGNFEIITTYEDGEFENLLQNSQKIYNKSLENGYSKLEIVCKNNQKIFGVSSHTYIGELLTENQKKELEDLLEVLVIFLEKFIQKIDKNSVSENISIKASISDLASVVAHEVKTPLQFLLSKIQVMRYKYQDENFIEDATLLEKELNRVNKLVHELLDITKFSVEKKEFPLVDLKEILQESVELIEKTLDKENVKLTTDFTSEKTSSKISSVIIKQIVMNLVNNSLFALNNVENKEISISLKREIKNNIITITDNGTGIKKENLPHIFEKGFSTKLNSGGTGLGLYAVKLFVKTIGGSIDVFSEENNATSFVIKIPFQN